METEHKKKGEIEYSKMQGFDVLEKLPDEKLADTYNEQFYSTLSGYKFLSMTIPDENKLFYHFQQNENASVSANVVQVLNTYKDLFLENENVQKILYNVEEDVTELFKCYENIDVNIENEIKPEIIKMERRLQNFLVEQKTENFKLIKEIAILEKEKAEIQENIQEAIKELDKIERLVGVKDKSNSFNDNSQKILGTGINNSSNMTEKFNVDQANSIK